VLLLALDTSTPAVTVAVVEAAGGGCADLAQRSEIAGRRHGERLAPVVSDVLQHAGARPSDVGAVVAGVGPGPFTGLRVGLVTAVTMAEALAVPTYAVCSLDAVAAGAPAHGDVVAVTDARRREVYWASYSRGARVQGPAVDRPSELAGRWPAGTRVVGAGALAYPDAFASYAVDDRSPYPDASALAALAAERASRGAPSEPLTPLYLRRPDATPPAPAKNVKA
jgi:tRNA threonylcarbamoyl adenosine modification protein YeaZ